MKHGCTRIRETREHQVSLARRQSSLQFPFRPLGTDSGEPTTRSCASRRSAPRVGPQLASLPRQSGSRRGHQTAACPRADRPTTGRGGVSGHAGTGPRLNPAKAESWAEGDAPELIMVSPQLLLSVLVSLQPCSHQRYSVRSRRVPFLLNSSSRGACLLSLLVSNVSNAPSCPGAVPRAE
jgi:hypothetical protein